MSNSPTGGRGPSRLYVRAAHQVLGERFPATERDTVVSTAARTYGKSAAGLPHERTLGARIMLRTACFDVALYRTLVDHGVAAPEARAIVAEVNWRAYRRALAPSVRILGLDGDAVRRTRRSFGILRRTVFRAPGWDMHDVEAGPGELAVDVRRCPLAEYFAREGLPELCEEAMCGLDDRQAEADGIDLTRTGTIAGGADRCTARSRGAGHSPPGGGPPIPMAGGPRPTRPRPTGQ